MTRERMADADDVARKLEDLDTREVFALAIAMERANASRFRELAGHFRDHDPAVADTFQQLATEEEGHERLLEGRYAERYRAPLPRVDLAEIDIGELHVVEWSTGKGWSPDRIFEEVARAEEKAREFYLSAAETCPEPTLRELYRELAAMEAEHVTWAETRGSARAP